MCITKFIIFTILKIHSSMGLSTLVSFVTFLKIGFILSSSFRFTAKLNRKYGVHTHSLTPHVQPPLLSTSCIRGASLHSVNLYYHSKPLSPPLATTDFLLSPVLPFPECHIDRIIQYVTFPDWLLAASNIHLKFFHFFSWLDCSFLFSTE